MRRQNGIESCDSFVLLLLNRLRWATQRGIDVVSASGAPQRVLEYLHGTEFDLTDEQIGQTNALNVNAHFNDPGRMGNLLAMFG